MLRPREYAYIDAASSGAVGLPPVPHGLLLATNEDGQRWTLLTDDVGYWEMLTSSSADTLRGLEIPADKFPLRREGWPDDWRSALG